MQYRVLGRTGFSVSTVSFGAWALGGDFGSVDDGESLAALKQAVDLGVNFFDTADVYGDGRSERLLGKLRAEVGSEIRIATKAGRRLSPHQAAGYNLENLTGFVERSLKNLDMEALDLVQLHCPPTDVYYMPEVFGALEQLVATGKVLHFGVSVERVEEAIKAIEYPVVKTVQIIYNLFRQRPEQVFLPLARQKEVGVLARLPLSSGLLAGKMTRASTFEPSDHRNYNRHGEAFDRGETFSGVDYELGLDLVERLRPWVPDGVSLAQFALRWILMDEGVTTVIPGAKRREQVSENVGAADLAPLDPECMAALRELYRTELMNAVHHKW